MTARIVGGTRRPGCRRPGRGCATARPPSPAPEPECWRAKFADFHHLPSSGSVVLAGDRTVAYTGVGRRARGVLRLRPRGHRDGRSRSRNRVSPSRRRTDAGRASGRGQRRRAHRRARAATPAASNVTCARAAAASSPARRLVGDRRRRRGRRTGSSTKTSTTTSSSSRPSPCWSWSPPRFAAFNLVNRIVEAQRREIGIGMALGAPRRQLACDRSWSACRSRSSAWSPGSESGLIVARAMQRTARVDVAAARVPDAVPGRRVRPRGGARVWPSRSWRAPGRCGEPCTSNRSKPSAPAT